jgi:hypothetical protein
MLTNDSGEADFTGLAGDAWYNVAEKARPDGYIDSNTPLIKFAFKIKATYDEIHNVTAVTYQYGPFVEYARDTSTFEPFTSLGEGQLALDGFLDLIQNDGLDSSATDHDVDVFNAKTTSDMPSTGGQILLYVGIAGVLALGALTFGVLGLRKRKTAAASVQAA